MFEILHSYLIALAYKLNIFVFIFIGSIVEEIIAPIPSVAISTLAGTLAKTQEYSIFALFLLAIFSSLGKTFGATILYIVSDKAEDFIMNKIGKRIGVTHAEVEKLGKYFNNSYKDYIIFILLRAVPIIPSPPLSIGSGVIKLNMKLYVISTFIGSVIRSVIFITFGYMGISIYKNFTDKISSTESLLQILFFIAISIFIVWIYYKRAVLNKKKSSH